MKILDALKWVFPKPQIPQKRYLIIFGTVLYFIAKAYVGTTPTKVDDEWLEKIHNAALVIFASEDPASEDDDPSGTAFGESA